MDRAFPGWKRALDLFIIFVFAPIWLPAMTLVAALVKMVSPGPAFFCQERMGRNGRTFTCYKFRSMRPDAGTRVHEDYLTELIQSNRPMTKLDQAGDPRLIPMGRVIRSTGLDELPQLINVLRGEMSLVGPRPCTPHEFQSAKELLMGRLAAPPGLTGYWQVNGKNKTTFREMIAMDEFYAKNMSLFLDVNILLRTVPAIIRQVLESRKGRPSAGRPNPAGQSGTGAHPEGHRQGI